MTVAAKELSQAAANMEVDDKSNLSPGKGLSVLSSSPEITDNKISAQPHTIVNQICFLNGNVLFLSLSSLSKN